MIWITSLLLAVRCLGTLRQGAITQIDLAEDYVDSGFFYGEFTNLVMVVRYKTSIEIFVFDEKFYPLMEPVELQRRLTIPLPETESILYRAVQSNKYFALVYDKLVRKDCYQPFLKLYDLNTEKLVMNETRVYEDQAYCRDMRVPLAANKGKNGLDVNGHLIIAAAMKHLSKNVQVTFVRFWRPDDREPLFIETKTPPDDRIDRVYVDFQQRNGFSFVLALRQAVSEQRHLILARHGKAGRRYDRYMYDHVFGVGEGVDVEVAAILDNGKPPSVVYNLCKRKDLVCYQRLRRRSLSKGNRLFCYFW